MNRAVFRRAEIFDLWGEFMLAQQVNDEAVNIAKQHLEGKLNVSISLEVLQKILSDEDMAHIFILEFNNHLDRYRSWYDKDKA